MESDNEQNENNKINILQQLSQQNAFDYLDNNNDCLTDAFITIYESSLWCIKFFINFFWRILLFTREELYYNQNETINNIDVLSMNNSADGNYSKKISRELPHHHLSKLNISSNKTRVTIRSRSNQNQNHTSLTKEKNPSNTLGTINSHITVVPRNSSHCQNDLKQSENMNLREQLADTLCRRSYEPLTFINRGMYCGHCRPLFYPNVPFHHSGHCFSSTTLQQELNQEKELFQKSKIGDASETQSTASPNIESHLTDSRENEPLSIDTITNNGSNEQNQSILSFPEHDTSPSQKSEELIDNDNQLKLNAQLFVDDSIQNAQEKYQEILRMNTDQNLKNNTLATVKQIIKNQSKSAFTSNDDNSLCQELCNKLNLSDSNQIAEIVRILASNAPHILKEQPPNKISLTNNSNTNKDNENTLCSQLLLHPPFKPKRLIYLCPDGSIQVLSAIDENSNENQIINQQQYHLNYSNSAITPAIQQNHILDESSLGLVDVKTNFNHMMLTESTSTQQSHSKNEIFFDRFIMDNNSIVSLQQKKTLFQYDNPLTHAKDNQLNNDHSKTTISQDDDPIVKINLNLNDETMEENSEDDENSLPEIFFKRIIAPESSTIPLTDDKNEVLNACHKNHQKSRYNHPQSYCTNKKSINLER